jgi:hypothetical protein
MKLSLSDCIAYTSRDLYEIGMELTYYGFHIDISYWPQGWAKHYGWNILPRKLEVRFFYIFLNGR